MELTIIETTRKKRNAYQDEHGNIYLDCTKCNEKKGIDLFGTNRKSILFQKNVHCKACTGASSKAWKEANKERTLETGRLWYQANREYKIGQVKKWLEDNTEKRAAYVEANKERKAASVREWAMRNKERKNHTNREWAKANRERCAARDQKRRAAKRNLPTTLTGENAVSMIKNQNCECYISGESFGLELEHFIPISWGVGGTTYENCYYMATGLNRSKGNRNPFEWIKQQPEDYQDNFHNILVPELAARNNMSIEEFTEYVYQCEKNAKELVL